MKTKFINLLPAIRARMIRKTYFIRLATIIFFALATTVFLYGILSIPTYIYLNSEVEGQQQVLSTLKVQLSKQHIEEVEKRITKLNNNSKFLETINGHITASGVVRRVLTVPRVGVTLSQITYFVSKTTKKITVMISGNAGTRNELQQYQRDLQNTSFISSADLPVDVYAKEKDIAFTMKLTGTFKP